MDSDVPCFWIHHPDHWGAEAQLLADAPHHLAERIVGREHFNGEKGRDLTVLFIYLFKSRRIFEKQNARSADRIGMALHDDTGIVGANVSLLPLNGVIPEYAHPVCANKPMPFLPSRHLHDLPALELTIPIAVLRALGPVVQFLGSHEVGIHGRHDLASYFAAATTFFAASVMPLAVVIFSPLSFNIFRP